MKWLEAGEEGKGIGITPSGLVKANRGFRDRVRAAGKAREEVR